ncbi:hypothetical protein SSX86_028349 [Deinandra increscens subsp. villosa]|uniref:DUF674 family protein n=1 Tax=Deinandra increscens subsp. villosa TaxID=3103831 RepID=A0AAP0GJK0_9ASTR
MDPDSPEPKFTLKLMVHKQQKRVIFAEADSNFVDTLFSIMTFPMASILRLLLKLPNPKTNQIGCLINLYQSLCDLPMSFMSSEEKKWALLNPRTILLEDICRKLKVNIDDGKPTEYFICQDFYCSRVSGAGAPLSNCDLARCSHCGKRMNVKVEFEDSTSGGDGDNENRSFDIGPDQILLLLQGALSSKNPMTWMLFPGSNHTPSVSAFRQEPELKTAETSRNLMLKVTIQKSTSKFLFAEAHCDFVAFLIEILQIPLSSLIGKLLKGVSVFQSLKLLFSSISDLTVGEYMKSHELKNTLLQPDSVLCNPKSTYCYSYFKDGSFHAHLTLSKTRKDRDFEVFSNCLFKDSREGRYLKESAKFMLTDDLIITPLSSFSSTSMLGKLKVPLNDVEVHDVSISVQEVLGILDASSRSSCALSKSIVKKIIETKN